MSDDERDLELESAEKRAHHNALERKRRDHIKDSFTSLRESVPCLQGERVAPQASRAQILKKAAEYIDYMRKKNNAHQHDIEDLKHQNNILESQIRTLEKAKATGNFAVESGEQSNNYHDSNSSASDSEVDAVPRQKKIKTKKC